MAFDFLNKNKLKQQSSKINELENKLNDIFRVYESTANLVDITASEYFDSQNSAYLNHAQQVDLIQRMYDGETKYGTELTKALINLCASFSLPNGLTISAESDYESEKAYIEQFLIENNLKDGGALEIHRECERQGQLLLKLVWDDSINNVRVDYIPWHETGYTIASLSDYSSLAGPFLCTYRTKSGQNISLDDSLFNVIFLNSRLGKFEGRPKLGGIINVIIGLSQDLEKWHQIIHLLTHPTPSLKLQNAKDAQAQAAALQKGGWKLGQLLITNGDFNLVSPSGVDIDKLYVSIETAVKIIAGATGIQPTYLGFLNVASNKSVTENVSGCNETEAYATISLWSHFYQTLFDKVIKMRNSHLKDITLATGKVHPCLVTDSDRQASFLKDIALPAAREGLLSKRSFIENIPGLDVAKELANQQLEKADIPDTTEEPYPDFTSDKKE
jgi:hypothetical protein